MLARSQVADGKNKFPALLQHIQMSQMSHVFHEFFSLNSNTDPSSPLGQAQDSSGCPHEDVRLEAVFLPVVQNLLLDAFRIDGLEGSARRNLHWVPARRPGHIKRRNGAGLPHTLVLIVAGRQIGRASWRE